jgi:TolA-binding protein
MKYLAELLQLSFVIVMTAIFFACSPVIEKPQQNDFFNPVDRIVQKKAGSDTLVTVRENDRPYVEDSLKDSLIVLYSQQNKRLGDMIRQLNLLTKKNNSGFAKDTNDISEILANRNHISNEMLLEKIKDQNQHLNDVVEQLKILSQNQQAQSENHNLLAGTNAVPLKSTPAQQVPVLITGANAVPAKSAPASKVSIPRSPHASVTYGKAIELYKSQQYVNAIDVFEKLLKQKIEPTLADRYHFWMGVCYLNLNKTKQAIKEFTKVVGYSNSDKVEEAYFMLGQCYERTGAKKSAKMTYEKMLQRYPQGNLKQVVEKKLALLK